MAVEPVPTLISTLVDAVNAHDLDALVACFASTYRNETPVHPTRGFEGHDQVRENWARIFAGVPDIRADVLRVVSVPGRAGDGAADVVWSEWEMRGTRPDGIAHVMRGVIIFGVTGDQAVWARFYLEPVDDSGDTVRDAVSVMTAEQPS